MRHVALEVPLRPLAVVRRGQRHHAADARIQPLRDALDRAALAGRVAALEQDHDLLARGDDPVLQLDQLGLQAEQLAEVLPPILLSLGRSCVARLRRQRMAILDLHLELFVVAVDEIAADPQDELIMIQARPAHGQVLATHGLLRF